MSAALKLATLASGLTIFTTGALYSMRTPQQDFSRNALALDHIAETQETAVLPKAKLPSNFVSFTIRGYEFKNAA